MAKQAESIFKERVLKRLKTIQRCWFVKVQQVSKSGTPDILLSVHGMFVAIELKTDKGRLSPLQEYNLQKIVDTGGISIVMTPKNFQQMIERMLFMVRLGFAVKQNDIWR